MLLGRLLRTRVRRWSAVGAVALVSVGAVVALQATDAPPEPAVKDVTIAVPAGPGSSDTIDLDASLYLPTALPAPAVIVAHGFGGSKSSVAADAERLARSGFVALAYSARGFGASGGQIALDSLDYEVPDARALVSWLAKQPEVTLDGPDDPRVGVTGGSYGGALSLMLAGTDPRVDAVVAVATWNNLEQALFPNNAGTGDDAAGTPADVPAGADGVFKKSWAAALLSSVIAGGAGIGSNGTSGETPPGEGSANPGGGAEGAGGTGSAPSSTPGCGRLKPAICAAYTDVAQTGRISPEMTALLAKSSPAAVVADITAPTMLLQGESDTLFGLDQADANARGIAAGPAPLAVSWYAGGHNGGAPDTATEDRITAWFQHYLSSPGAGSATPSTEFQYSIAGPVTQRGQARQRVLTVPQYPGLGGSATPTREVAVELRPQLVMNPPGGEPAAITSLPGVSGSISALAALGAMPGQTAQFVSEPLADPLVVTGSIPVQLTVSRLDTSAVTSALTGKDTDGVMGEDTAHDDGAVLYLSVASLPGSAGSAPARDGAGDSGDASGDEAAGDAGAGDADDAADGTAAGSDLGAVVRSVVSGPAGGAVAPIRITDLPADGSPTTVTVHLPAVAFQVAAGNRLAVRVSTTDQGFAGPKAPAIYRVSLAEPTLAVPAADGRRAADAEGNDVVVPAIGLGVLLLVTIVGLFLAGRPRRRRDEGPAPAPAGNAADTTTGDSVSLAPAASSVIDGPAPDGIAGGTVMGGTAAGTADARGAAADPVPLVIDGLAKRYPGGVMAVSDVSFRVERGQVLGLLGPNGAGKTTTLRMVMGLIMPTAGTIQIFGEPARPGAPVLSRIGSFVEGSGFLPHLSGRANLELYWRATGRPAGDAHLEQALAIADLGTAVHRRVKTYSQGMRQRLAIAQAMLGLPDLMLLDEPTNGLDPPQIHAMREVLRRYAATGRTVLVSSHLLSEVEQTCSHVVVMSRGRTIAAGTVAELVATSGEIAIGTPDGARAAEVLRALPGVGEAEVTATGVSVDLRSVPLTDALAALLAAGVRIESAAPRNRLEDVFLDLVAAGPAGGESALNGRATVAAGVDNGKDSGR